MQMHMRSDSKQMKKLNDPMELVCARILFFRGFVSGGFFLFVFWSRGFLEIQAPQHKMARGKHIFLRCKTN